MVCVCSRNNKKSECGGWRWEEQVDGRLVMVVMVVMVVGDMINREEERKGD